MRYSNKYVSHKDSWGGGGGGGGGQSRSVVMLLFPCFLVSSKHHADTVGFVGLGNMGAHMARNLLKKGYPLVVYDLDSAVVNSVKEAGVDCILFLFAAPDHKYLRLFKITQVSV